MTLRRPALLLLLLGALALGLAACGGSDDDEGGAAASSSTDVNELLTQTFSGDKEITSGNLDLKLDIEAQGGDAGVDGPISVSLTGPFQSGEDGTLPEFSLDAALEGAGQSIKAGATSTGDKGFVSFQGTDYVLEDQVFEQFKAGYEEAQKQGQEQQGQSFASLGMDPRKWLTDPKNAGEAKVGDDDTVKITGGVDVAKLLDDVNVALEKASSLGVAGAGEVPQKLTEQQRRQVLDAVKDPQVEIYTGKDDQTLRQLSVKMGVEDTGSGASGTVAFDVKITDLNEDQDIAAPQDAKPFSELMSQLGGLGLGATSGGGSSSGGSTDGSGSGATEELGETSAELEKYSSCLEDAGSDVDKARECADLLTP